MTTDQIQKPKISREGNIEIMDSTPCQGCLTASFSLQVAVLRTPRNSECLLQKKPPHRQSVLCYRHPCYPCLCDVTIPASEHISPRQSPARSLPLTFSLTVAGRPRPPSVLWKVKHLWHNSGCPPLWLWSPADGWPQRHMMPVERLCMEKQKRFLTNHPGW